MTQRTNVTIYNKSDYNRLCAIAKIENTSVSRLVWTTVIDTINKKYPKGSLDAFLSGKKIQRPDLYDSRLDLKKKYETMPMKELKEYGNHLSKHVEYFDKKYSQRKYE